MSSEVANKLSSPSAGSWCDMLLLTAPTPSTYLEAAGCFIMFSAQDNGASASCQSILLKKFI